MDTVEAIWKACFIFAALGTVVCCVGRIDVGITLMLPLMFWGVGIYFYFALMFLFDA